ncbi:hypothetical protein [Methylobacterium segetis]|uniref:hypothetical protein n=1 Tax=Methylobacterium segetis TaxID=2488750 RepID=UPI001A9FD3D4|nr:hypothetical protein [Methylobacterium segetis]
MWHVTGRGVFPATVENCEDNALTEEHQELLAKVQGLQIVLAAMMNLLPEEQVRERLRLLEDTARKQNMLSGTIEMLRDFREKWEQ